MVIIIYRVFNVLIHIKLDHTPLKYTWITFTYGIDVVIYQMNNNLSLLLYSVYVFVFVCHL